jgi:TPR repeat protein
MRKACLRIAAVVSVLAAAETAAQPAPSQAEEVQKRIEETQRRIEDAQRRIEEAQASLREREAELARKEADLRRQSVEQARRAVAPSARAATGAPSTKSLYDQASALEQEGRGADAVALYIRSVRAGNGKAALRLGEIYDKGLAGVGRDYPESLKWYNAARVLGEEVPMTRSPRRD